MRVFLTGATGFIGSRIVPELIAAGHQVLGLARSDTSARALQAMGAGVYRGTLDQPETLRDGAAQSDAVIHTAFDHDFSHFAANCEKDRQVIRVLGDALKGSHRPLLITSGTAMGERGNGQPATEDGFSADLTNPRVLSELEGDKWLDEGVDVRFVRLPQVHDTVRQGLITPYIEIARQKGIVAYIGAGNNRWPAAHVTDVATLYVLALTRGEKGKRYHAVAQEGIAMREIAQIVSERLGLPQVSLTASQSPAHFGWFAFFADKDLTASGAWTRLQLGWTPTGPGLLEDLGKINIE
ncbi:SDR family oxidoreductase [Shimwellia pseudoproteus]|uniref:SDR family oxidoreductase n=1 Tax=Shimwellia pseudoproteus TaxID=570012 RepID=UPI0018EB443B|nr:SDR family oxidoreductase [Shimwellia pseudoproteus]MBJ3815442.1 SDR family oxidoreductase [Shimwellia pseudoproteus]